jgi:hypothetical protein
MSGTTRPQTEWRALEKRRSTSPKDLSVTEDARSPSAGVHGGVNRVCEPRGASSRRRPFYFVGEGGSVTARKRSIIALI